MATYQEILAQADEAGREAADSINVIPMVVTEHANPLDDSSPVTRKYFVEDGICGFACIKFPARGNFFKEAIANGLARKNSYGSGARINVYQYNQSYQLKTAYADAFAEVLREHGIKAYVESRLD